MTVQDFLLMNVGGDGVGVPSTVVTSANPQLQFFENFPGHNGQALVVRSQNTLSVHAVNIPLSISFNYPTMLNKWNLAAGNTVNNRTHSFSFGLYSMNGSTLSLANSASATSTVSGNGATSWVSWMTMATSATQNITPGAWYFALNISTAGDASGQMSHMGNSSINPVNAIPGGFFMGRMTVSTGAMPNSIATSDLDITGADAIRQPYILISA